jgi:hypothetical protein
MKFRLLCAAFLVAAATSSTAIAKTIDKSSSSGDYAIASASGTVKHPKTIKVKVTAKPNQKVTVSWTMVCSRGLNAGSKSGQYKARTPTTRALKKPMSNADDCIVSANAQLDSGGHVTIAILG